MTQLTNQLGDDRSPNRASQVKAEVTALILRVGERVRKARERKGISRRVLSEISGVSPRYLAQLEAGEGNISIGLLQRVAIALDHSIDRLMVEDGPQTSEALKVAGLFQGANAQARQAVLGILEPDAVNVQRARRICLIGLRGAGKSTLGALAGKALNLPFVELKHEIETQSGVPLAEVMALYGHEGYRHLETQAIAKMITKHETIVLAVAGGIVSEPDTYDNLLKHFHTIWLRTTPDEHMARVRDQGDERPMAGNSTEAMDQLRSILADREALYGRAQAQIDTSGRSVETSLNELLTMIDDRGFLA